MKITFLLPSFFILAGGVFAVLSPKLIHSALGLAVSLAGLAVVYLHLGAEFAGFVQILVYVGAVAILIVFAILLTSPAHQTLERRFASRAGLAVAIAMLVGAVLAGALLESPLEVAAEPAAPLRVREIGHLLMGEYIIALEIVGLLLTSALIGAVVIASLEKPRPKEE